MAMPVMSMHMEQAMPRSRSSLAILNRTNSRKWVETSAFSERLMSLFGATRTCCDVGIPVAIRCKADLQ
jgi:hypothetical protein